MLIQDLTKPYIYRMNRTEREKLEELFGAVCLLHAKQCQNEVQPIHGRQRELEALRLRKYGYR